MKFKHIILGIVIFSTLGFLKPTKYNIYPPKSYVSPDLYGHLKDEYERNYGSSNSSGESLMGDILFDLGEAFATQYLENQKRRILEEKARAEKLRKEQYPEYSSILYSTRDFKIVGFKGKEGVVNNKGYRILPIKYDKISYTSFGKQKCFQVELFDKTAIFNIYGNLVVPLKKYDNFKYVDNLLDFIAVEINNKKGIYSLYSRKKEIIPPTFDEIKFIPSINGLGNYFLTESGDKKGVFNEKGNVLFDTKFDEVNYVSLGNNSKYSRKKKDYFIVKYGKYKGLYDKNGKYIIPSIYSDIKKVKENSTNKVSVMIVEKNNKKGLYNIDTKERLLPAIYDEISNVRFDKFDGFNYRKVIISTLKEGKYKDKKLRLNSEGRLN